MMGHGPQLNPKAFFKGPHNSINNDHWGSSYAAHVDPNFIPLVFVERLLPAQITGLYDYPTLSHSCNPIL